MPSAALARYAGRCSVPGHAMRLTDGSEMLAEPTLRCEQPLYRPPSEGRNLIIQARIGCSFHRCTFCSMSKAKTFRARPLADVIADIDAAASVTNSVSASGCGGRLPRGAIVTEQAKHRDRLVGDGAGGGRERPYQRWRPNVPGRQPRSPDTRPARRLRTACARILNMDRVGGADRGAHDSDRVKQWRCLG